MKKSIRTLDDIQKEKERIKRRNSLTTEELKSDLSEAKSESQDFALKKVLLPVGIALIAGYGLRKIMQSKSDSREGTQKYGALDSSQQTAHSTDNKGSTGFDWFGTLVKFVPFAVSVGQKLYDDGHLSFLFGESDEEEMVDE